VKLSLFIIRAFVNTRENRAANAAILKRLAVPGEPINEAGGRFRGLNISARHVPSSEMSQRKLFEPDTEPVFDSAYRPDARIVLVQGDSLETLRALPASVAKLIITSPPYPGLIDYHEQHRYSYELLGLVDRRDEEIGPASRGQSRQAVRTYVEDMIAVFANAHRQLPRGAPVIIVVNDSKTLYPEIVERSGLSLEERLTRHVNRRTGRRAGEFFEDVLVCSTRYGACQVG